jgi:hypothetical protein
MHSKIIHSALLLALLGSASAMSASKAALHLNGRILEYPTIIEALEASRDYSPSSDKTIVLGAGRIFLKKKTNCTTSFLQSKVCWFPLSEKKGKPRSFAGFK